MSNAYTVIGDLDADHALCRDHLQYILARKKYRKADARMTYEGRAFSRGGQESVFRLLHRYGVEPTDAATAMIRDQVPTDAEVQRRERAAIRAMLGKPKSSPRTDDEAEGSAERGARADCSVNGV